MNVEVKNSIDRLISACRQIDSAHRTTEKPVTDIVVDDIRSFISIISTANSEERLSYFNEVYLGNSDDNTVVDRESFPAALSVLCQIDNSALKSGRVSVSSLYVDSFLELGKSYLFSKQDKKDIDMKCFTEIVKGMQDYIDSHKVAPAIGSKSNKTDATKGANVEATTEKAEAETIEETSEESLEELMEQLDSLIGLESVKTEVNSLINLLKLKQVREKRGFKAADVSKHLVFLGNPGTGKTTVARLLSKIYKQLGVLEKGQLVEVDRAGLVAGYVGQTALKTKEKIDEAMGGILFIDEAYTLAKGGNDFGQEAIDTILKAMEDMRDSFIVIVAGYPEPMEHFLDSNPGLKSRFNKNILFEDYTEQELLSIFDFSCQKYGMHLSTEARFVLTERLNFLVQNKSENFANGREMRNWFECAYSNQANRLANYSEISDEDLNEISVEDLIGVGAMM